MGKGDIQQHLSSKKHSTNSRSINSNQNLKSSEYLKDAALAAEIEFTHFLVEHNCNLAAADHAFKLFKSMFCSSSKFSATEII